jgi:hypothetical protein
MTFTFDSSVDGKMKQVAHLRQSRSAKYGLWHPHLGFLERTVDGIHVFGIDLRRSQQSPFSGAAESQTCFIEL